MFIRQNPFVTWKLLRIPRIIRRKSPQLMSQPYKYDALEPHIDEGTMVRESTLHGWIEAIGIVVSLTMQFSFLSSLQLAEVRTLRIAFETECVSTLFFRD